MRVERVPHQVETDLHHRAGNGSIPTEEDDLTGILDISSLSFCEYESSGRNKVKLATQQPMLARRCMQALTVSG